MRGRINEKIIIVKAIKVMKQNAITYIFFLSFLGFHMTPKLSKIFPESCLLIVVGVVIGLLLYLSSSVHVSPLTPDTFFLYMLPPIILDAGYFMPNRLFFDHLGTILLFAVVGTIFNTLTIGKYDNFFFCNFFVLKIHSRHVHGRPTYN